MIAGHALGLVWCLQEVLVSDYERFRLNSVYPSN
jgi:hypothetical protein